MRSSSGFTLVELLVAIAIIAILSVVLVLVLNPTQLLEQSRDANRLSDLSVTNTALGVYAAQGGTAFGSSDIIYLSTFDPTATSSLGDQCQGLHPPAAPSGYSYFCGASSTYRNVDGTGWIPINFLSTPGGSPLGELPDDPINQTSSGLYYTFNTNGSAQYEVSAIPESQKYRAQYATTPSIIGFPGVMASGNNLMISPLWSNVGLVGYWPFEEGSGTSTNDGSGNGNVGLWNGTAAGNNGTYYVAGKVGSYAGAFDGSTDYVYVASAPSIQLSNVFTIALWFKSSNTSQTNKYILFWGTSPSRQTDVIYNYTTNNVEFFAQGYTGSNPRTGSQLTVADTNWHFIVYSYNSSTWSGYLDGAQIFSASSIFSVATGTGSVYIGTADSPANVAGDIDDLRIYNRSLAASEVQALYNSEK